MRIPVDPLPTCCNLINRSTVKVFEKAPGIFSKPLLWNENTASAVTRITTAIVANVNAKNRVKSLRVDHGGRKPGKRRGQSRCRVFKKCCDALCVAQSSLRPSTLSTKANVPSVKPTFTLARTAATLIHLHNSSARSRSENG